MKAIEILSFLVDNPDADNGIWRGEEIRRVFEHCPRCPEGYEIDSAANYYACLYAEINGQPADLLANETIYFYRID